MALPIKLSEALALGFQSSRSRVPAATPRGCSSGSGRTPASRHPTTPWRSLRRSIACSPTPPPPPPPEALADFDADRMAARYAALLDEVATRSSNATSSGTTSSRR